MTTGEGERFLSVIFVPVPDRPLKGKWTSQCSGLVMEKVLFLSTAGLGLRVDLDEKGVVPRDLVGVQLSRDLTSNLSFAFETDP